MKIDLEKAKKEFIKYTEKYNLNEETIKRKQQHSLRVMELSKEIATRIGLEKEEIELATLIGLLHDIARFEQYTQYKTLKDIESFDHGDYGVKILYEEGLIKKYIETNEYDEIIKKAIKNHNKLKIEEGLNEKEMIFAKLIRDADKIDILYESTKIFWIGEENNINETKITEKYWKQVLEKQLIKREKGVNITGLDSILSVIVFIFDINFKESFQILEEENYINQIIDRFDTKYEKEKMKELKKIANEYIKEKG